MVVVVVVIIAVVAVDVVVHVVVVVVVVGLGVGIFFCTQMTGQHMQSVTITICTARVYTNIHVKKYVCNI